MSVLVDGALLVTRFNSTQKNAARLAIQLLGQINAPLMGGVLNDVETSSTKYGAYQYYNYKLYSKYYDKNECKLIMSLWTLLLEIKQHYFK